MENDIYEITILHHFTIRIFSYLVLILSQKLVVVNKEYNILIENDQKKIQYCKDHNIELRIIKYNQDYSLEDLI